VPTKKFLTIVPIGGGVTNALADLSFEFPDSNVNVTVAATVDAPSDADMQIQFGQELVMERSVINTERGAGVGPILPDNVVMSTPSLAGRRLIIELFNNDAILVANVTILIETTPI